MKCFHYFSNTCLILEMRPAIQPKETPKQSRMWNQKRKQKNKNSRIVWRRFCPTSDFNLMLLISIFYFVNKFFVLLLAHVRRSNVRQRDITSTHTQETTLLNYGVYQTYYQNYWLEKFTAIISLLASEVEVCRRRKHTATLSTARTKFFM